jgi:dTDP-4-dehydrorhamnose reductase
VKILVTGARGQLGREAVQAFTAQGHDVTGIGREALDLTGTGDVAGTIAAYQADWIINCAAYTQVDRAEEEAEQAFAVNRDAARAVAQGAKQGHSRLLHVSTDFIFSGKQATPYREDDKADPLSVYGQSKWEGEQAIIAVLPQALIMRTAWVYGVHGNNFVKTMLRLMAEKEEVRVVDDQIGTPTWTGDIVSAMHALMDNDAEGIYHFTNEGVASWYDLACEILSLAPALGYPVQEAVRVTPVPGSQWPCAAQRPACSVLSKEKIRPLLPQGIPYWRHSLHSMLKENAP